MRSGAVGRDPRGILVDRMMVGAVVPAIGLRPHPEDEEGAQEEAGELSGAFGEQNAGVR